MTTLAPVPETVPEGRVSSGVFEPRALLTSLPEAVRKLDPRQMWHNPVMFVVLVGAVLTTIAAFVEPSAFAWWITVWLWLTVVFANLAEAVAEGRGRAQAASLRATRRDTMARRLDPDGRETTVAATELRLGDRVVCEAGDVIPGDGDVVEGVASVDESAITGESAPVIRESGGDRSAVTGGTKVLSDRIVVQITAAPGHTFIDRMIALVEGASRQKTPNEVALNILLSSLTIIFLLVVMTLQPLADYSGATQSVIVLVALLVCLIPTTIGALLSAIGIAGMDRLVQRNVLAMSGRAVEAAGDVSTLLLDKTGTITLGNRQAVELIPAPGVTIEQLADAAQLSSLADETPEGRSIVVLCKDQYGLRARDEGALAARGVGPVHRADPDERRGCRRTQGAQGRGRRGVRVRRLRGRQHPGRGVDDGRRDLVGRGHAAGGVRGSGRPRRRAPQGRRQGRHPRALRRASPHGDPHGDDHGRQPDDRTGDRRGGRGRRLPGGGDARGQDGAHQARAGGRAPGRDDGRRHERRPGAGAGRRRRRDEHRHLGGQGGRQHGRPRLQSDEAHRHRRDRQAAAHHARRAHDLLGGQRHREVLRDHPGDVRGRVSRAGRLERHGPVAARTRRSCPPSSSTHWSSSRSSRWPCVACGTARRAHRSCSVATCGSTDSEASSCRSSASSSSTCSSPASPESGELHESHSSAGVGRPSAAGGHDSSPRHRLPPGDVRRGSAGVGYERRLLRDATHRVPSSALLSSASPSTATPGSGRVRPPPATGTTPSAAAGPTSPPTTPISLRLSASGSRRSQLPTTSRQAPSPPTR